MFLAVASIPGFLPAHASRQIMVARPTLHISACITNFDADPLIAKAMVHLSSREEAIAGMKTLLTESSICGPPTNLDFLAAVLDDPRFKSGDTMTSFLESFTYVPHAIDVI